MNWLGLLDTIQTPLLSVINAVAALLIAFNVVFTQTQLAATDGVVNAVLFLAITIVGAVQANKAKAAAAK